ncbi:CRAL/TRIO domain-containing protein [Macroventuria anomochaeta]|uniref:CRAL/TRIO domain-containing protein n=1 Tax=Macroventuria anomochaeta TaxID=301207 RepID=A0ACB6SJW7_9PLEO|nr:CRAL/TRIO domain-containing protein [Macroventuria anomochaeta]KAF2633592.1 CRAL/TRIO domain-containing protein [Macroventuria anomochaeta]
MAENTKPAPPAEGAGAPLGDSTEKQDESIAPQSTESAEKGLEANTEKKEIDDVVSGTAGLALDEKKAEEPMPPVAPQPAIGVESVPTEASQKASDAVPVTATGPSTVPTAGDSGTAAGAAGVAPGVATTATGAVADAPTGAATGAATGTSSWPETAADHPLTKFYETFEELVQQSGHDEVYGVKLTKSDEFHTKLILQKFLRANANDLDKAKQQLLEALKWRKEFDPTKAAGESFDKTKFDGLGYIIEVDGVPESANKKDIVTFNIYGAVKDNKATFGDLDAFLRWRVGLMEKSIQKLNLSSATKPIPNYNEGPDPYQGFQVHDYLQVSFLRQDPLVKAATKKTIEVLGRYYPETLSRKFFVNVPVVMGWLFNATKLFIAKETVKKFTVLSYGNQLATELGQSIPIEYGGTQGALSEVGEGMQFAA